MTMETNTAEYGPKDIAKMLAPMRLLEERKLTFHSELADRIKTTMGTDDADFVVEFLEANDYLWYFNVEGSEKNAYILTHKGMDLLRRYL